jgi:pimeloyl-ACP methyl ester carboxylesterase
MSETRSIKLMLLPGLLNDAGLWQHQCEALAPLADVRVADLTRADTMQGLAASVLQQAPAGPFALAGLSMGGYVAFEIMRQLIAREAAQRVIALALLDTSARPDTPEASDNRRQAIEQAQRDFSHIAPALMQRQLHPSHLQRPDIVEAIKKMSERVGRDAYIRQQRAIMGRADSRPILKKISCPTLMLCGREDRITPVELHEEMAHAMPAAHLSVIEQSGHLSALEQPQAVSEAMQAWLESLEIN